MNIPDGWKPTGRFSGGSERCVTCGEPIPEEESQQYEYVTKCHTYNVREHLLKHTTLEKVNP